MDAKKFKRNPLGVQGLLKNRPDGSVVTAKPVRIYIPAHFAEHQLANLGGKTFISGIFMIAAEDFTYGVSTTNAMMEITPTNTVEVQFGDETYLEFLFEAGSTVFANRHLVKADMFIYSIYNVLLASGHIPWFLELEDLGKIFRSSYKHAGVHVGANDQIIEMIAASIARSAQDRTQYYRHVIQNKQDVKTNPPAFIPLRSVTYGATNTTAKLMGAYFDEGLVSAIMNPADQVEPIEELLRY